MIVEDGRLMGKESIQRASVIDEIWVLRPGLRPNVYVSLLHKPSKDWWENPGGQIAQSDQVESIVQASVRERDEESRVSMSPLFEQIIQIDEDPNKAIRLFATFEKRIPEAKHAEYLLPLQSHMVVSRRFFTSIPDIVLGARSLESHLNEHDEYRMLDVHGLYYPFGYLFDGAFTTLKNHLMTQMTNRILYNSRLELLSLSEQPNVVSFSPLDEDRAHEYESLNLSLSTIVSLWRYSIYSNKFGLPVSATGNLLENIHSFSLIKPYET